MTIFATLTPIDLGTNTRVTVRVCASQDVESTGAAGERWWPAMVTLPVMQARFFDGDFTSSVEPPTASIDLRLDVLIASGAFPGVERYDWAGASCRLQRLSGGSLVDVQLMQVESFASEAMILGLRLRAASELYDAEVLRARYAGTTGAEGGADLRGQLKPWVFGRALNVEPVFINQIDNVFQVSGYGPVQAISSVYERGSSFGASVGDFATYAALVAATIPPGRWATCLAQGMFRLGAPPAGVITCDVDGDSTGGFLRRTGAILSEIANRIGLVDKVSSTSMTALDTAVARNVNIVIREQTSFIELAQRMLAPCNAVASVGLSGRLIASRVSFGAEQFTLDAQGREMPPVLGMARQNTSAPYKRVQMGAARSWRVHTFDEIAFYSELIDRGLYAGATVYREGNIVESADKSRWVYINPTPSSGNAPPASPSSGDAFWSSLAPGLDPIAIGVERGATRNEDGGGNMIADADTLALATYTAGANATVAGGGPAAQLAGADFGTVLFGDFVPVRGGERLYFSYVGWADIANGNSVRGGYTWRDGGGAETSVDLPDTALSGTAAVGLANQVQRMQAVNIPANAVSLRFYVVRPSFSAGGSFFIRRPYVGRAEPGATVGAPAGTNVAGVEAAALVSQAAQAATDSASALTNAAAANTAIANITADNILSIDEKPEIRKQRDAIIGEYPTIRARAVALSVSVTVFDTQYSDLIAYLDVLDLGSATNTTIVRNVFNTRFINYFNARQTVLDAIAAEASVRATWASVSGPGRPQDNATNTVPANANRVPFSRMEGNRGWTTGFTSAASSTGPVQVIGSGRYFISATATFSAAGQSHIILNNPRFSVDGLAGQRLSVQSRVDVLPISGPSPASWQLTIQYFQGNTVLQSDIVASGVGNAPSAIFSATPLAIFSTVPAGAETAWLFLSCTSAGAGQMAMVVLEPMVTSAAAGQTLHPPFSPGPNAFDAADITAQNVAAAIAGQQPWATSTIPTSRLNLLNDAGRSTSRRINSQIMASGIFQTLDTNPITATTGSGSSTITINAHDVFDDAGTLSFSSASISGLSPATTYYVWESNPDFVGGARTYVASTNRNDLTVFGRRFVGFVTTPATANDPPAGGGGAGGGGWGGGGGGTEIP